MIRRINTAFLWLIVGAVLLLARLRVSFHATGGSGGSLVLPFREAAGTGVCLVNRPAALFETDSEGAECDAGTVRALHAGAGLVWSWRNPCAVSGGE